MRDQTLGGTGTSCGKRWEQHCLIAALLEVYLITNLLPPPTQLRSGNNVFLNQSIVDQTGFLRGTVVWEVMGSILKVSQNRNVPKKTLQGRPTRRGKSREYRISPKPLTIDNQKTIQITYKEDNISFCNVYYLLNSCLLLRTSRPFRLRSQNKFKWNHEFEINMRFGPVKSCVPTIPELTLRHPAY